MIMIQITGIDELEGWRGYLGPLVGKTSAQGECYITMITPPPYEQPLTEVILPLSVIRKIKAT